MADWRLLVPTEGSSAWYSSWHVYIRLVITAAMELLAVTDPVLRGETARIGET